MKSIWLIGASEGIGRALAIELANDQSNSLILSARNNERLLELSSILNTNTTPLLIEMDVENRQSVTRAWQDIQKKSARIDTIIYCAGYYKPMSAESMEIDEIEKMINVNLVGAMRVLSLVIPEFIKRKNGHIVLIGSIAGYRGLPNGLGYGSSKAGIIHLAENLKCDLADYNVKVQVINPGFVKTRLTDLNRFHMPSIITPTEAAVYISSAMKTNSFESRFPFIFANFLNLISKLPYWIYFVLAKIIKPENK